MLMIANHSTPSCIIIPKLAYADGTTVAESIADAGPTDGHESSTLLDLQCMGELVYI